MAFFLPFSLREKVAAKPTDEGRGDADIFCKSETPHPVLLPIGEGTLTKIQLILMPRQHLPHCLDHPRLRHGELRLLFQLEIIRAVF